MAIKIENLYKSFGSFTAVDQVSFSVNDGEFVTLLGPSGSGKSTVLRCIAGLESPDGGNIEINEKQVNETPVQKRRVGFVFQHYALFKNMTLAENVAFGLKVKKVPKEERINKAKELLKLVGLAGYEERYPTQLSGGQRQRVALARALAPEPSLLLLDEPFGALDTQLRKELRSWLKKLHNRIQLTTLLVTHDQDEAFELSDRIIVMNQGRVEQEGVPSTIFDKPATEFVASFIGESNKIYTQVTSDEVRWGPLNFGKSHAPEGTPVTIHFRPSDVYVSSTQEADLVPGTITDTQFMGSSEYLTIELGPKFQISAQLPKGLAQDSGFVMGKRVFVRILSSHVFLTLGMI